MQMWHEEGKKLRILQPVSVEQLLGSLPYDVVLIDSKHVQHKKLGCVQYSVDNKNLQI